MPPLTRAEAELFVLERLAPGLQESFRVVDQLLPLFPWKPIRAAKERSVQVATVDLGGVSYPGAGGAVATSSRVPTAIRYPIRRIAKDTIIDSGVRAAVSAEMDLAQILVDGAFRGILITLGDGLINGSSAAVPAQIDGFKSLVDPAQAIIAGGGPDGAALSIADLRHLLALVTSNHGRADFLVANRATFRKWLEIQYSAGIVVRVEHLCPEHLHACAECVDDGVPCPGLIPVLMQDGVPFLVSDHVLSDEVQGATAGCTSVYAGVLDPAEGLCLTYPAQLGRAPIKVTHTINPLGDQELWRASLNVGLSMCSKGALARLKGVLN